jgi:hypothetical protein
MAVPKPRHAGGRPRLYNSPEEMQEAIDKYFAYCEERDKPKTMQGLANALGMERHGLLNYADRDEFYSTVKNARDIVTAEIEEKLLKSGQPTIGCIFWLKNNAGWVDKQEIETTSRVTLSVPDDVEDTGNSPE